MRKHAFSNQDQVAFAAISGDFNDLHMNAVAARRSLFGSPVVHGVNAVLWALDYCLRGRSGSCNISRLKALFMHQIRVGDEVQIRTIKNDGSSISLRLFCGDTAVARIKVELSELVDSSDQPAAFVIDSCPDYLPPIDLSAEDLRDARGDLELYLDREAFEQIYPALAAHINLSQLAVILGATRIVGVHCPGKYSLFSELELATVPEISGQAISYEVTSVDDRFGLVEIALRAPGMAGKIMAFRRPGPREQQPLSQLCRIVEPTEFAGQRAVVIGGSRGLGEVTAKLLVAGGADVKISFYHGHEEAAELVREMQSFGGRIESFHYDALQPGLPDIKSFHEGWRPTHLYYFATPFIATGVDREFSMQLFGNFCNYYLAGLDKTLAVFESADLTHVFNPSSVMLDQRPDNLREYVAAKAASEVLAKYIQSRNAGLTVCTPRLPKMETDQTANVAAIESYDPAPVMLAELRKFKRQVA